MCNQWGLRVGVVAYLPASKAGEARGESSAEMVKMPSNFRSGYGFDTVADTRAKTLIGNEN